MISAIVALMLAGSPEVGSVAPDFTVKDIDGTELTLSKLVEQGPVIVAFFPKAFTGGCTKEMSSYRDRYNEVIKMKGRVLAVSMDDVDTLKKWRAELKAPQTFIADPDGKLVKLYDTKMPVMSMASRNTFVVGPGRKVLEVQKGGDAIETTGAIAACGLHKPTDAGH